MTQSKYSPIFSYWKRDIPMFIGILLLMVCVATYCILTSFPEDAPCEEQKFFILIKSLLLLTIIISVLISILKAMKIYLSNIEKERNLLSDLYAEEQKRAIIKTESNSEETENKLKKEIQSLSAQLEEVKKSYRQQVETEIQARYQIEKIRYLEELNKQLLADKKK